MIGMFILGAVLGASVGALVMACCAAAGQADDAMEKWQDTDE